MPASLPGATKTENEGTPTQGRFVTFDPLSGPKAGPLDARKMDYTTGTPPGWNASTKIPITVNDPLNLSTGALSTGIGFGPRPVFNAPTSTGRFAYGNYTDDYVPGQSKPDATLAADARMMYIGGGRSNANGTPNPIAVGAVGICGAGEGGAREVGNNGLPLKLVTSTAGTAVDATFAAPDTGYTNRSEVALTTGQSAFGVSTTALADTTVGLLRAEETPAPTEEQTETEEETNGDEDEEDDDSNVSRTPRKRLFTRKSK